MTGRKKSGTVVDLRGRLGASILLDEVVDLFGNQDLVPVNNLLQGGLREFGPEELVEELRGLGAVSVTVKACDVSDRERLVSVE